MGAAGNSGIYSPWRFSLSKTARHGILWRRDCGFMSEKFGSPLRRDTVSETVSETVFETVADTVPDTGGLAKNPESSLWLDADHSATLAPLAPVTAPTLGPVTLREQSPSGTSHPLISHLNTTTNPRFCSQAHRHWSLRLQTLIISKEVRHAG